MENDNTRAPKKMRYIFGLFMVAIYIGMGVLIMCDFFNWIFGWIKYVIGILLVVYGFWRGYREFKK